MTLYTLLVLITFNEPSTKTEDDFFHILNDDPQRDLAILSIVHLILPVKVCSRPYQHVNEEKCRGPAGQQGRRVH